MSDIQKAQSERILSCYGETPESLLQKSQESELEKGGKRALVGEKRTFGNREYIKTADGWKFHGKGTGTKAQEHATGATPKTEKPEENVESTVTKKQFNETHPYQFHRIVSRDGEYSGNYGAFRDPKVQSIAEIRYEGSQYEIRFDEQGKIVSSSNTLGEKFLFHPQSGGYRVRDYKKLKEIIEANTPSLSEFPSHKEAEITETMKNVHQAFGVQLEKLNVKVDIGLQGGKLKIITSGVVDMVGGKVSTDVVEDFLTKNNIPHQKTYGMMASATFSVNPSQKTLDTLRAL